MSCVSAAVHEVSRCQVDIEYSLSVMCVTAVHEVSRCQVDIENSLSVMCVSKLYMKYQDAGQFNVHMLEWFITLVNQYHKLECEGTSVYCDNTHKIKLGYQCIFKSCKDQRQECWLNVVTVNNILTNVLSSMMLYYRITIVQ